MAIRALSLNAFKRQINDSFYSNTGYLIVSSLVASAIGLIFWVMAAGFYSQDEVGIATAIISLASIVINISRLGLGQSLIRFFPEGNKSSIFSSTLIFTTGFAFLMGVAIIATSNFWSPALLMSAEVVFLFLALVIMQSIFLTMNNTFIALRKANISLIQNIILGSRLFFLIPLFSLGLGGILASLVGSFTAVVIVSIFLLLNFGIRFQNIDCTYLKSSFQYSAGNYFSNILSSITIQIIPILILNQLGPGMAASYYIAFSFATIATIIPTASNTSLFVEGSHGTNLKKTVKKSLITAIGLFVPVIVCIYIGGDFLFSLLGKGYAIEGLEVLKLLLLSNLLLIPYSTYITILNIQKNIKMMVLLGLIYCISLLILSYSLMDMYGLNGIGYAWIITSLIGSAFTLVFMYGGSREKHNHRI